MRAALVYPHQLFDDHPALAHADRCYVIEDPLFFKQYAFHRQKLAYHRATMTRFASNAHDHMPTHHLHAEELQDTASLVSVLKKSNVTVARVVDPNDDWLQRRLTESLQREGIRLDILEDPHFLTPRAEFARFADSQKSLFFTAFYMQQRKRLDILLDKKGKPIGGKWSFDTANRRKLPKDVSIPTITWETPDLVSQQSAAAFSQETDRYVGSIDVIRYPTTRKEALRQLRSFLTERAQYFGDYEDAIHADESFLFHSVLTPALNVGLLSPRDVVDATLEYAEVIPLNSLEGFIRQVIGWREYVRGVYRHFGRRQRTSNFFDHQNPMPKALYEGTTGIDPVDAVIARLKVTAYSHHIERLMILGNFMLLCEIHPDAVYQWFMEFFIDAYDWVMVPNVYGMSQYADGGRMTTKPYISGSAYVLKMSNFPKGNWCETWDALYWRFIDKHRGTFADNPRMQMMVSLADRLGTKLKSHRTRAEQFLERLHAP